MTIEENPEQRRDELLLGQIEELLRRVDQMPAIDSRSAHEVLGYDEHGLPR